MAKSSSVSYDFYVMAKGKWVLKGRFPGHRRDYVLKESKAEEAKNNTPVKVVRDFYNEDAEAWEEVTVYVSGNAYGGGGNTAAGDMPPGGGNNRSAGNTPTSLVFGGGGPALSQAEKIETKKKASTLFNQLTRFLLIILGSFVIAIVVTIVAMQIAQSSSLISPNVLSLYSTHIAIGVFVLAFMFSSVPLLFFFIDSRAFQFNFKLKKKAAAPQQRAATQSDTLIAQLATANPLKRKVALTQSKETEILEASVESVGGTLEEPVPEEQAAEEEAPQQQFRQAETLTAMPSSAQAREEEIEAKNDDESSANDALEENQQIMMRFLKATITAFRGARQQLELNGYNKFGMQLVLSGAVETLAQSKNLSSEQSSAIFQSIQNVITVPPPLMTMFQSQYQDHLEVPRYLKMVETGRLEMRKFVDNFDYIPAPIARAFDTWEKGNSARTANLAGEDHLLPAGTAEQQPTVLLAEVTLAPQAEGEAAPSGDVAKKIQEDRNALVQHVLQQFFGLDIRDGGHSVTATFPDVESAVQAGIALHNMITSYQGGGLQIRTGIFSPGAEMSRDVAENEAWNLCGAAHYGQILCNEQVSRSVPPEKISGQEGGVNYVIAWEKT